MQPAEKNLLEGWYPDRTEEQAKKQLEFLKDFATSPAFLKTSRLGPYRFTFPLEQVLTAYSQQFCSGAEPTMRVFETVLYKQEVMYSVLVHSPANQELFSEYPLLTEDENALCTYKDGHFIWRSEAMCETHRYQLVHRPEEQQVDVQDAFRPIQYYVWDHVSVALHVEHKGKVLKFPDHELRKNIDICREGKPLICQADFTGAAAILEEEWPVSLPEEEGLPQAAAS